MDPVGIAIAVVTAVAFVAIGGGLAYAMWPKLVPAFRVAGLGVFAEPRKLAAEIDPSQMQRDVDAYISAMGPVLAQDAPPSDWNADIHLNHVSSLTKKLYEHVKTMRVTFHLGALLDSTRTATGLNDLNNDGKRDTLSGLTYGPSDIVVGVLPTMLVADGRVLVEKTAWRYEFHNAIMWLLFGYDVVIAEEFVDPDDKRLSPYLDRGEKRTLTELKALRAKLDGAFSKIQWG